MSPHQKPWAKGLESLCLIKLKELGGTATAHTLAAAILQPMANVSPRLNALAIAGLVRDTGRRVSEGRGRPLIVWTLADADAVHILAPEPALKAHQIDLLARLDAMPARERGYLLNAVQQR